MTAKSPPALVEPALLKWGRESLNLTIDAAATKLSVSTETVMAWEAGEKQPSIAKLRQIATAYKRPMLVFFLPKPPEGFEPMKDFRRVRFFVEGGLPSPELTYEMRRAHERREIAIDLAQLLEESSNCSIPSASL